MLIETSRVADPVLRQALHLARSQHQRVVARNYSGSTQAWRTQVSRPSFFTRAVSAFVNHIQVTFTGKSNAITRSYSQYVTLATKSSGISGYASSSGVITRSFTRPSYVPASHIGNSFSVPNLGLGTARKFSSGAAAIKVQPVKLYQVVGRSTSQLYKSDWVDENEEYIRIKLTSSSSPKRNYYLGGVSRIPLSEFNLNALNNNCIDQDDRVNQWVEHNANIPCVYMKISLAIPAIETTLGPLNTATVMNIEDQINATIRQQLDYFNLVNHTLTKLSTIPGLQIQNYQDGIIVIFCDVSEQNVLETLRAVLGENLDNLRYELEVMKSAKRDETEKKNISMVSSHHPRIELTPSEINDMPNYFASERPLTLSTTSESQLLYDGYLTDSVDKGSPCESDPGHTPLDINDSQQMTLSINDSVFDKVLFRASERYAAVERAIHIYEQPY